jgi:hypothetical protein
MATGTWLGALAWAIACSGCGSDTSTSVMEIGEGGNAFHTMNGKTVELKDGVLTYDGRTFPVPDRASVRVERRRGNVVALFVDDKPVMTTGAGR